MNPKTIPRKQPFKPFGFLNKGFKGRILKNRAVFLKVFDLNGNLFFNHEKLNIMKSKVEVKNNVAWEAKYLRAKK